MAEDHILKEFIKTIEEIFVPYMKLYSEGKMTFSEYAIIENILLKLQFELEKMINEKGTVQQYGGD